MDINLEMFTQFRLVFGLMLGFLLLFFIISLVPKGREPIVTFFSVLIVSITHAAISIVLLLVESTFLEDFGMEADSITFYLFLAILVFAVLNPIIYRLRNRNTKRRSYSFR